MNKTHIKKLSALGLAGMLALLCGCTGQNNSQGSSGDASSAVQTDAVTGEEIKLPEVTGTVTVTAFNVGKADALVIETANSVTVIDAGNKGDGKYIDKYLSAKGISKVDNMIITHFDKDHVGGAGRVLNKLEVQNVYVPAYEGTVDEYADFKEKISETNTPLTVLPMKDVRAWTADDALFTLYAPNETNYGKNEENDFSLVLTVQHGEQKFLFAGDAEAPRQQEILDLNLGSFQYLKFPYHGNYMKTTEAFLDAVAPQYAVVCCSEKEYADAYTVETLKKRGVQAFYTCDGNVTAVSDGKTLTVTQG